jgi:hypothetical protein
VGLACSAVHSLERLFQTAYYLFVLHNIHMYSVDLSTLILASDIVICRHSDAIYITPQRTSENLSKIVRLQIFTRPEMMMAIR